jgi:hypothetical protein
MPVESVGAGSRAIFFIVLHARIPLAHSPMKCADCIVIALFPALTAVVHSRSDMQTLTHRLQRKLRKYSSCYSKRDSAELHMETTKQKWDAHLHNLFVTHNKTQTSN